MLERAGSKTVEIDGKRISGKRFMAQALFEIVTTGRTRLADGRELVAGPNAWFDIVKFIYAQIDGPPPKDLNLGGQEDNPIAFEDLGADAERRDRALSALAAAIAGAVHSDDSEGDTVLDAGE